MRDLPSHDGYLMGRRSTTETQFGVDYKPDSERTRETYHQIEET